MNDNDHSSIIVDEAFWEYIERNNSLEPSLLRLSASKKDSRFDVGFAIDQIECRKKTAHKLKNILINPHFLFPDVQSSEQASHQAIALYHASLCSGCNTVLDMTSGLGIDTMTFAKEGKDVVAFDIDEKRSNVLRHNCALLGLNNVNVACGDSLLHLMENERVYDLIFVDPSRRDTDNRRQYNLHDCTPDVLSNFELIRSHCNKLLIKASPMLDISQTLIDIPEATSIRVVGVKGECKELLIEVTSISSAYNTPFFEAVDLDSNGEIFSCFKVNKEKNPFPLQYAGIEDLKQNSYILEPSAMIMKLSPWSELAERFDAKKIHKSSHLFISSRQPTDFPGRVTKIEKIINKKDYSGLKGERMTVISRNHPLSAEELRKKLHLKEGDKKFLYATRIGTKPVVLLTSAV